MFKFFAGIHIYVQHDKKEHVFVPLFECGLSRCMTPISQEGET